MTNTPTSDVNLINCLDVSRVYCANSLSTLKSHRIQPDQTTELDFNFAHGYRFDKNISAFKAHRRSQIFPRNTK